MAGYALVRVENQTGISCTFFSDAECAKSAMLSELHREFSEHSDIEDVLSESTGCGISSLEDAWEKAVSLGIDDPVFDECEMPISFGEDCAWYASPDHAVDWRIFAMQDCTGEMGI